jgi:hypothetical protein
LLKYGASAWKLFSNRKAKFIWPISGDHVLVLVQLAFEQQGQTSREINTGKRNEEEKTWREGERGDRGVLIANRTTFIRTEQTKLRTECEIIWTKMQIEGTTNLYIGSFYRNPKGTLEDLENLQQSLSRDVAQNDITLHKLHYST